ncbi:copper resistance system multicopper oxidase, partial [Brevundimonas naejangsanensis]
MAIIGTDRRSLLRGAAGGLGLLAAQGLVPAWARSGTTGLRADLPTLHGPDVALSVGRSSFTVGGRTGHAVTVNGTLPAPLIRLREGQNVRLSVTNHLDEDTSIHWHGLLLPFQMDGVPGISFPGIKPHETFVYEFPVRQSGTYWYHSHSGLQEAIGHFGPMIIDPAGADPVAYDREHVLVLSDWSFLHPHDILNKLKKSPGYFNQQKTTLAGLLDGSDRMSLSERRMWGQMRMDPRDILDVNGTTYTYLVNGHGPDENWTGLFQPGERVRLRIINASAMSIFNVRIPGLAMTVVQADGEHVQPVEVDEFQISVAETYDVIVRPTEDRAYTIVSEAIDRSGMGRAT